jgi:hypothetical protein
VERVSDDTDRFFDAGDDEDDPAVLWPAPDDRTESEPEVETLTVTATNPARTVSATALLDGRLVEVRLERRVGTTMTESELAEQIALVARLANRQGKAAQHAFTAAFMHQLGHDPSNTRSFLERTLGLPSPDTVLQERAAMFPLQADDH